MKKVYKLNNLDCACCAEKMEHAISKIPGVVSVSVNFFAQKIVFEVEDNMLEDVINQASKIIKKIEPDCRIVL